MKAVAGRGGVRRVSTDLVGPKEMELVLRIFPTHPLHPRSDYNAGSYLKRL